MPPQKEHDFILAARNAGQQLAAAFQPVMPYLLQAGASMAGYTAGLAAAQAAGMALRVSCATPVAGPVGGLLGVGFASAAAGQASIKCRQYLESGRTPLQDPWRGVRSQDVLLDALLGVALFKAMGGRFRSVMPSDLARVGAIARESLPAKGAQYASESNRTELVRFFRRDGCHHCGTRRGSVIGDHMPPNKHAEATGAAGRSLLRIPLFKRALRALNLPTGPPKQRYFPQCGPCCQKQSAAIRNSKMVLVFHEVLHRGGSSQAWHFSGALLGLRHYSCDGGGGRARGGGGAGGTWSARRG